MLHINFKSILSIRKVGAMKKFIIILLLILPIFLMVTISFASRIFSTFVYIDVERVAFVDSIENEIDSIKINKGEKKQLYVKIYPDLANNKKVEFSSLDEDVVVVSATGEIEGINYGFATIVVKSLDSYLVDKLIVNVTDEQVESIDIDLEEKTLNLYQSYTLSTTIYPLTALDKKVYWSSSHPEYVSVDANGKITAHKITDAGMKVEIVVTTRDGAKTDSCYVTVTTHVLAFRPQVEEGSDIYISNQSYIDLFDFIVFDNTKININDIKFACVNTNEVAVRIEGDRLIFNNIYAGQPFQIKVYAESSMGLVESRIFVIYIK